MMDSVCQIEILKKGRNYSARAYLASGVIKEYQHTVFEEVLTELAVDLQELLDEN
jgi:hypothetical protein